MKKIGKFFKEHRIFTILMAIVIVCLVLIMTVLIECFYLGNGTNQYGNRLEGIEKYEISKSRQSDFEHNLANNEKVKSVDLRIQGKIVYINMQIETGVALVEAESIAKKSLEQFSDEEKGFYDFHFTLKQDATEKAEGFIISGAKNKNSTKLVWNLNKDVEDTTA